MWISCKVFSVSNSTICASKERDLRSVFKKWFFTFRLFFRYCKTHNTVCSMEFLLASFTSWICLVKGFGQWMKWPAFVLAAKTACYICHSSLGNPWNTEMKTMLKRSGVWKSYCLCNICSSNLGTLFLAFCLVLRLKKESKPLLYFRLENH